MRVWVGIWLLLMVSPLLKSKCFPCTRSALLRCVKSSGIRGVEGEFWKVIFPPIIVEKKILSWQNEISVHWMILISFLVLVLFDIFFTTWCLHFILFTREFSLLFDLSLNYLSLYLFLCPIICSIAQHIQFGLVKRLILCVALEKIFLQTIAIKTFSIHYCKYPV